MTMRNGYERVLLNLINRIDITIYLTVETSQTAHFSQLLHSTIMHGTLTKRPQRQPDG